ncbi:MAG: hypothetical protein NVSMB9_31930 [Isosphaeraceae bacterium]
MAYTAPVIATSGITWAQLKGLGFQGTLAQVALANNLASSLVGRLKSADTMEGAYQAYSSLVDQYLAGDPVDLKEVLSRGTDLSKVFHALAQAADDINALVTNNPGTIRDVISRPVGDGSTLAGHNMMRRRIWT